MEPNGVITLDNLADSLRPWTPDDESHVYAVVDMGSNGIRFSITSLAPPRTRLLTPIYSTRAAISLFDALTPSSSSGSGSGDGSSTGTTTLVFPPEIVESVSTTLAHYARIAQLHNVPASNTLIFATEAMRRASNAADMLDAIARVTGGLRVHVLAPPVETLFGAVMGSRSGLADVRGGALFLDLGGGSVQMTWVDTSLDQYETVAARAGVSMPYGAARLTRILEQHTTSKPNKGSSALLSSSSPSAPDLVAAEISNLHDLVRSAYDELCRTFPRLKSIRDAHESGQTGDEDASLVDVYMCGGGFRGYGSMLMHTDVAQPYPMSSVGTYTVSGASFKRADHLRRLNAEYRGKIHGMSRRRRSQFDAIATVVSAFASAVPNIRRVTFCKGSNRDGALMMMLPRHIRESDPLEVLASIPATHRPLVDVVISKLSAALPPSGKSVSSLASGGGLASLFARDLWGPLSGSGYESAVNISHALHFSVARDPDTPGLTHLARATLAISSAARWGSAIAPADQSLAQGMEDVLARHHPHAVFWAKYSGAVAGILTQLVPVLQPADADKFDKSIRLEATTSPKEGKKDRLHLSIHASPDILSLHDGPALDEIADFLKSTVKTGKEKPPFKVSVQIGRLEEY